MSAGQVSEDQAPEDQAPEARGVQTRRGVRPRGLSRWLALPAIGLIRLYQWVLSPVLPNICRFQPSCSHYAMEAYQRRGVWWGTWLTVSRVVRCNPFSRGGFDPVPDPDQRAP